ncbi:MAG: DUF2007 domain-containing protein [candidate division WOR-3 bacterium]
MKPKNSKKKLNKNQKRRPTLRYIWSLLLRTNPQEGEIIRGKLESSGIKVRLEQEAIGKISGFTLNGLGETRVFVPKSRLKEAKKILQINF